jgi:tRNA modification GTPase
LEYSIDFPEEEQTGDLQKKISKGIKEAVKAIDKLLDRAKRNIMLNRGALTVIAGEPNVGKSSLFNALLGKERAIVTEEAGTTRDAVEMETMIGGYLFRLVDTAGLRKSGNKAEKIGVEYSRKFIDEADLVLFVHEAGADLKKVEKEFLKSFEKKSILRIINKIDLMDKKTKVPDGYIPVSAKMGKGIKELKEAMVRMVLPEKEKQKIRGGPQVISLRQKNLLEGAKNVLEGTDQSLSAEFIVSDLEEAGDFLGELTGQITSEEVLDEIFSRFCIGK